MSIKEPKILFLDIETLPNLGYSWGKYEQNIIRFTQETCIASYAAKWLGGKEILAKSLASYNGYRPYSYDDAKLVKDLWKLIDEADIVVAHNGISFDLRVIRGRFIFHKMKPPSPIKVIDTKNVSRKVARFNSNKLDDLAKHLSFGGKIKTDFDLWEDCIKGDKSAWHKMLEYNKYDVVLLETLYSLLLPWNSGHPNVTLYRGKCPKCGSEDINYRGVATLVTGVYRKFQCQECGGWGRETKSISKTDVTSARSD